MRRFVFPLLVLIPMALVVAGCGAQGGGAGPENPEKMMQPTEMKMPPDIAKRYGKETPAPGVSAPPQEKK